MVLQDGRHDSAEPNAFRVKPQNSIGRRRLTSHGMARMAVTFAVPRVAHHVEAVWDSRACLAAMASMIDKASVDLHAGVMAYSTAGSSAPLGFWVWYGPSKAHSHYQSFVTAADVSRAATALRLRQSSLDW